MMFSFSGSTSDTALMPTRPLGAMPNSAMVDECVLASSHYFQILWAVVLFISVDVVNYLFGAQRPSKNLGHNISMLTNHSSVRHSNPDVSIGSDAAPALPVFSLGGTFKGTKFTLAQLQSSPAGHKLLAAGRTCLGNPRATVGHDVTLERKTAFVGGKPNADGRVILTRFPKCLPTCAVIIA